MRFAINGPMPAVKLGKNLFKYRDYTPLPLLGVMFLVHDPSVLSATAGTVLVLLGECLRIYSVAFIGTVSRTRSGSLGASLVREGPFKWTRNPLYLGNFIIVLGFACFVGVFWFLLLSLGLFYFQYYYIIQYEEAILSKRFGDEYLEYQERTPIFFPKKLPEELKIAGDLMLAFKSERSTFLAIVVLFAGLLLF